MPEAPRFSVGEVVALRTGRPAYVIASVRRRRSSGGLFGGGGNVTYRLRPQFPKTILASEGEIVRLNPDLQEMVYVRSAGAGRVTDVMPGGLFSGDHYRVQLRDGRQAIVEGRALQRLGNPSPPVSTEACPSCGGNVRVPRCWSTLRCPGCGALLEYLPEV